MTPPSTKAKKPRSRIACKRCHDRRTKCDVSTVGAPCSGCMNANLDSQCQILNSKRTRGENGRFSGRAPLDSPQSVSTPGDTAGERQRSGQPDTTNASENAVQNDLQQNSDEADVWSKVVADHGAAVPSDGRRVVYVGEPWTLAYIMQWRGSGQRAAGIDHLDQAHAPLADSPTAVHVSVPVESATSPAGPKDATPSQMQRSSEELRPEIQASLLDSYFSRHHTMYPVIDQQSFRRAFGDRSAPPCLRLAVLYAGALHAPDPVIHRAGFDTRQACLLSLYRRAKSAFFRRDDDGGVDQLSGIQSAFLLHNMWQGPNATMDPWTWLGMAIRMAQNIGMHRSTESSSLPSSEKRLWKRIWWCLYARDRQIASALGKPLMIRDEDCDVSQLTEEDFEHGDSVQMRHFVIQQTKLGVLFGAAISSLFVVNPRDPSIRESERASLIHRLESWKSQLPSILICPNYRSLDGVPFPGLLLEMLYKSQKQMVASSPTAQSRAWKTTFDAAAEAATAMTRVTETIMNHGSLTDCPLFFTSALFGAMTIHAIRGREAEQQLSLCMIAMRPLSTMYFAAGWIRNIFQKLNEKRTSSARPTRPPSPGVQQAHALSQSHAADGGAQYMATGGGDPWHLDAWPSTGDINAFGLMSRNFGGFLDYSTMPDGGFGGFDPQLADYWQDVLNTQDTF